MDALPTPCMAKIEIGFSKIELYTYRCQDKESSSHKKISKDHFDDSCSLFETDDNLQKSARFYIFRKQSNHCIYSTDAGFAFLPVLIICINA